MNISLWLPLVALTNGQARPCVPVLWGPVPYQPACSLIVGFPACLDGVSSFLQAPEQVRYDLPWLLRVVFLGDAQEGRSTLTQTLFAAAAIAKEQEKYWFCSGVDQYGQGGVEQWVGCKWKWAQGRVGMFALSLFHSVSVCREQKRGTINAWQEKTREGICFAVYHEFIHESKKSFLGFPVLSCFVSLFYNSKSFGVLFGTLNPCSSENGYAHFSSFTNITLIKCFAVGSNKDNVHLHNLGLSESRHVNSALAASAVGFSLCFWKTWNTPRQRSLVGCSSGQFTCLNSVELSVFQLKSCLRFWSISDQVTLTGFLTQGNTSE